MIQRTNAGLRRTADSRPIAQPMLRIFVGAALAVGITACSGLSARNDAQITTLSSRADMVTGGDALVRVVVPEGVAADQLAVTVNGVETAADFRGETGGMGLVGLVTGLQPGSNTLAIGDGENTFAEAVLTNYPTTGPVVSGPHETPFICETESFELITGETLGPPLDENCSVARRVDYGYRSVEGGDLKPLPSLERYPADLARTTTSLGVEVPYIVRIETGTANRGIYEIAMLHDPVAEPEPDLWNLPAGWNNRVVYTLGGGCPGGWYRQGARTGGVRGDWLLRQGYAVVGSTLNVYGNNCSDFLAAETAMMTKERFVEAYGPPLYTIGTGCSGGSYASLQIADNYPGIFDGIIPGCSYPDVLFATTPWNSDARLLLQYFEGKAAMPWDDAEQLAVTGFVNLDIMHLIGPPGGHAQRIRVGEACPSVLPEEMRYHPTDNPTGARCEVFEHHINVFGRNPETGFVRRPIDNVGVQYGLKALNDGVITRAQFLDLNEKIGGYDLDGNVHGERTAGDPIAMRAAYETGRMLNGGGGLAYTPTIEYRGYADMQEGGNVHPRFLSFSIKERLLKANGHLDNIVMLTVDGDRYGLFNREDDPILQEAFGQMDTWLTRLAEDTSSDTPIEKVRRARPADLVDACWTPRTGEEAPTKIVEEQMDSNVPSRCQELYPSGSFARGVAGSSIATDIIKCQLKPIDPSDYTVSFTEAESARLREIFPEGVCDWTQPGIEQTGLRGTWLVMPNTPAPR
ncbi:MAG: DUF6351 family protein [Gemmatimonadota bacterium]